MSNLRQAAEQEPVAWMRKLFSPELGEFFDYKDGAFANETDSEGWTPLYTDPPQRKPLSDEEIEQAYRYIYRNVPDGSYRTTYYWIEQGIRYAEQAHGIKGEA